MPDSGYLILDGDDLMLDGRALRTNGVIEHSNAAAIQLVS